MRSDLVFTAANRVKNPFLLCHLVRISSRRFHKSGDSMQHTINKILDAVTEHDGEATPVPVPMSKGFHAA